MANYNNKRFRTIKDCLKIIKSFDPETAITEHYIRTLVAQKKLVCLKSGTKTIIDFNSLERYLDLFNEDIDYG